MSTDTPEGNRGIRQVINGEPFRRRSMWGLVIINTAFMFLWGTMATGDTRVAFCTLGICNIVACLVLLGMKLFVKR